MARALDDRVRDWDDGNLFFQAVVGIASLSSDFDRALDRYVPGAPATPGDFIPPPDDDFVLAVLGAVVVKERLDTALAQAAAAIPKVDEGGSSVPTPLRALLR